MLNTFIIRQSRIIISSLDCCKFEIDITTITNCKILDQSYHPTILLKLFSSQHKICQHWSHEALAGWRVITIGYYISDWLCKPFNSMYITWGGGGGQKLTYKTKSWWIKTIIHSKTNWATGLWKKYFVLLEIKWPWVNSVVKYTLGLY